MSTTAGEGDVKPSEDRNDDVFVEQEDGFADDDLLSPGDNTSEWFMQIFSSSAKL